MADKFFDDYLYLPDEENFGHNRKLSNREVVWLRERRATGELLKDLSVDFGISIRSVSLAARGETYRDVDGPLTKTFVKRRTVIRHTKRKLSDEQVVEIRNRYANGETQTALAIEFGVSHQTIGAIVRGKTYKDVPGPLTKNCRGTQRSKLRKFSDEQVFQIRNRYASEETLTALATEFGASISAIRNIVTGKTYKDLPGPRTFRNRTT